MKQLSYVLLITFLLAACAQAAPAGTETPFSEPPAETPSPIPSVTPSAAAKTAGPEETRTPGVVATITPSPTLALPTGNQIVFTIRNDQPYSGRAGDPRPDWLAWGAQAFYSSGRRVWIDLESGQRVKEQRFWRSEAGHEVISSTSSYITVEKVDSPTQEILDMLARVIVP